MSVLITPFNASTGADGTIAASSTPQLVVAGASKRHGFMFQNTGGNDMGISWRTTSPAIGGAGTYTIPAKGTFTTPENFCPAAAIYVVGTMNDTFTMDIW